VILAVVLIAANVIAVDPAEIDAIAARLAGQQIAIADDHRSIAIVDVAHEGVPRVGVVEKVDGALWLVAADGRFRLDGPLARPRIAGPGYTVWVIGSVRDAKVPTLTIRRLGILRRPTST
jgi:hypothetical protein